MGDALFIAFALLLIVEGIGPMLFPRKWRQFLMYMSEQSTAELQTIGGVLVTVGCVSLFFLL